MVAMNVESVDRRNAILRNVARPARVDGLLLVSFAPHEEELARFQALGLPVVLVDAHHRRLARVVSDDVDGGRLAGRHMLGLGHRSIGFVGDVPSPGFGFSSTRLRLRGVEHALRDEGLAIRPDHIRRRRARPGRGACDRRRDAPRAWPPDGHRRGQRHRGDRCPRGRPRARAGGPGGSLAHRL